MAPWVVRVASGFVCYRWFLNITLLLCEASWLLYCIVGHPNPASAPSILLVPLEPHSIPRPFLQSLNISELASI